jgi:hypothetical protein
VSTSKVCGHCRRTLPGDAFHVDRSAKSGLKSWCKDCTREWRQEPGRKRRMAAANAAWRAANPERLRSYRREAGLRKGYGIGMADFDTQLAAQGGSCAICASTACPTGKALSVDHDHETGELRGILCGNCNMAIGCLQDDPRLLRSAIAYLEGGGVWRSSDASALAAA